MPQRPRKLSQATGAGDRLSIRIDLPSGGKIGPGKIAVLEQIARTGSISAVGGTAGGGAVLTEVGKAVVNTYRAIEVDAALAARKHLWALTRACPRKPPR